jgi:hypothetical protein
MCSSSFAFALVLLLSCSILLCVFFFIFCDGRNYIYMLPLLLCTFFLFISVMLMTCEHGKIDLGIRAHFDWCPFFLYIYIYISSSFISISSFCILSINSIHIYLAKPFIPAPGPFLNLKCNYNSFSFHLTASYLSRTHQDLLKLKIN